MEIIEFTRQKPSRLNVYAQNAKQSLNSLKKQILKLVIILVIAQSADD